MTKRDVPFAEYSFNKPNFEDIGGRATDDAQQLAMTIYSKLREHFPINCVPTSLVVDVELLQRLGEEFKNKAEGLIRRANILANS